MTSQNNISVIWRWHGNARYFGLGLEKFISSYFNGPLGNLPGGTLEGYIDYLRFKSIKTGYEFIVITDDGEILAQVIKE